MRDPYVAYICGNDTDGMDRFDHERDALYYLLEHDLSIRPLECSSISELKPKLQSNSLSLDQILMIIGDEWRLLDQKIIPLVEEISSKIPMYVYPEKYEEMRTKRELFNFQNIKWYHSHIHDFSEVFPMLKTLKEEYIKKENAFDIEQEQKLLKKAHDRNYGEDSIADHEQSVIAEYMRVRLLGGEVAKEEFDDVIKDKKKELITKPEIYNKELSLVRDMSESKRSKLHDSLLLNMGYRKLKDGGVFCERVGKGNNIRGYAIDPSTFIDLETFDFGQHDMADYFLAQTVAHIYEIRENIYKDFNDYIRKMITGYIHLKIPKFETPILELWISDQPVEIARNIGTHIIKQKKYLPLDSKCRLIDENYQR